MSTIRETLKRITVGNPRTFGGLSVYPLTGVTREDPGYTILDDALREGTARVTEISASGSVPELAFHNDGDQPVLVIDGEELAGAKQNRIVNLTLLAPAKQKIVIPVSCVEAGRWASTSEEFQSTTQGVYSRLRAQKYAHVSSSMAMSGSRQSDQSGIWDDIGMRQRDLLSDSPTARITDTYDQYKTKLDDYVRNLPCVAGQVGAVFALSGQVSCVELFDCAETLTKMWSKLIRSWALDALVVASQPHEVRPVAEAQALLEEVAKAKVTEHEAIGLGTDVRFDGPRLNGGALVHEERLVHLCVFRDGAGGDGGGSRMGRMARASRRRG
ncbi:MAG: hypothetical protein IH848_09930 [Acidobacteria bacterium]|nr:hypothetical protein [Acidobacteriota bacterium]